MDENNFKDINEDELLNIGEEDNNDQILTDYRQCDTRSLIDDISSKIYGQKEVISTIVNSIVYNQVLLDDLAQGEDYESLELTSRKINILLDGPSGTGKTTILEQLYGVFGISTSLFSCKLLDSNNVDSAILSILKSLYLVSDGDMNLAQRGIVILDDFDIITSGTSDSILSSSSDVQYKLLDLIKGGIYNIASEEEMEKGKNILFDSSYLTFIVSGSWTDLLDFKIQDSINNNMQMGFSNPIKDGESYKVKLQDYSDFGLDKDYFPSFKVITSTKSYDKEDLKNILLYSSISPLLIFQKTVHLFGYSGITCDEEFLDELINESYKFGSGAKGLQTIMFGIQNKLLDGLINHEYNDNEPIHLSCDIIREYKDSLIRKLQKPY